MIVPLRAAHPSQLRNSPAAVRFYFLLMLLALFGSSAFGQGLTPGGPYNYGPVPVGSTLVPPFVFTAPATGINIQSLNVVTEGAASTDADLRDFTLVSDYNCSGEIHPPTQCTVYVAFHPQAVGLRQGALVITNSNGVAVNTIYLSGVGVGPQFVFSPARATTTATATTLNPAAFTAGASVQDGYGNLYFTDVANNRILERSVTGVFSEVPTGGVLTLSAISGLAIDGNGVLYVSSGNSVYSFMPGNTPTVLNLGVTLTTPSGLALDTAGDLYIADSTQNQIYQFPLGSSGAIALTITGPGATFLRPDGLTVDSNNNLYVADSSDNRIVKVALPGLTSSLVSTGATLTLNDPTGVAVDAAGTIYIANTGDSQVVEVPTTEAPFVLTDPDLTLSSPANVFLYAFGNIGNAGNLIDAGNLIISDTTLGLVDVPRTSPFIRFPTPTVVGTLDATDDPLDLTVQSTGNIASDLTVSSTTSDPSISTAAFLLDPTSSSCPILNAGAALISADAFTVGEICNYGIDFQPTVVGPNRATLTLTTSVPGSSPVLTSTSTAKLFGIGLSTITHFSLQAVTVPATNPTTVNLDGSVELILTALQANGQVATDYVGTVTFTDTDTNGKYLGGTGAGTNTTTYTFTAADNGVLIIPEATGLQLNAYGVFTAAATDGTYSATSNDIYVIEPSTLTLTSSINPSLINQSTTFTLHIATTGTVTPGGTVTFYSNGVQIGNPVTVVNGQASIPDSFPAAGQYAITATYTSNTNTQGGTASLTQIVGNATAVTLTSSVNPSLVGQSTTFTAGVTAVETPTGTVSFYNGPTLIQTVPINGSSASITTSFATSGTYPITAVFTSNNAVVTGAGSGILNQVVENISTLTLTSSVNPSNINQSTTLTATLTALGTPSGTVVFYDGATPIGSASLAGNAANVGVSFATSGIHTLKAVFTSSNTSTENATSAPYQQVVLNASTVTLTSSVNPSAVNQFTTLTAVVKSAGTPTGTVTFESDGVSIGSGIISGGIVNISVSFPKSGTYTLIAVYNGDGNNEKATSNPVTQVVLNVATIALTSSVNPVFLDNPTILTALLTSTGPAPTGTVSFFDGNTPIGSGTLVNGAVSIRASFVYAGAHTITATYSGDAVTSPANAPALTQTVADFTLTVASGGTSSASTIAGGSTSYSLVVTPVITSTLPSAVSLSITGLPSTVTDTFTPASIASGSGVTPVALNVTAAQLVVELQKLQKPTPLHRSAAGYAPIALALIGLPLAWLRRRKRFSSLLASICLLVALTAGLSGCTSAATTGYYGQTPQTYNLTVTATSGNLARSTYLTLTVQ